MRAGPVIRLARSSVAIRLLSVQLRTRNRTQNAFLQRISQRTHLLPVPRQMFPRQLRRLAQLDNQRHALSPTAQVLLLMPAVNQRRKRRFPSHVQRPDTLRRTELVAGQRQIIDRHLPNIYLDLPRRLHRIAMKQHPARPANLRNLLHRKQHPRFIVCPHQRHHRRLIRDDFLQVRQLQQPIPVNRQIRNPVSFSVPLCLRGQSVFVRFACFADGPAVRPYLGISV